MVNLKGPCEHEEVKEWCKPLVPSCLWNVRIANLNSEAILASPSYVCGRENKLHTRALARLAGAGYVREWSAEIYGWLIGFLI